MQNLQMNDANVQHLVTVNYQRMMAFEQAAFNTTDEALRAFYEARADESEANLKELCGALQVNEETLCNAQLCNHTIKNIQGKKNEGNILSFIISFEKTVNNWYKKAIAEIKSLPGEIAAILTKQQQAMGLSQSALHQL